MGKAKFDLSTLMQTVSELDTTVAAPEVRMIPIEDLMSNKANFYRVDKKELGPLADSIAMEGLQQYPLVMLDPKQAGKYVILSGHRRCAAIRMLVEDKEHPREDLRLVPCTVRQYRSAAMAELQLILANSTTRVLSNAEIAKQADRLEALYYQLKEEGYYFPGRMRDRVAAACRVAPAKLGRLKVIQNGLIADYLYLFEKDKLPEATAYELARMPQDFQHRVAAITKADARIGAYAVGGVRERYEKGWRWEPDLHCPDGRACKRGDTFLRHDIDHPSEMCGGMRCCLECSRSTQEYYACDRMCSKAAAIRKQAREESKAKEEARAQETTRKYQRETQANALRLIRAIDAAGLPDDAMIPWRAFSATPVKTIRAYAAGQFPEGRLYEADFNPERLYEPIRTVKMLGCSADYLLGLTDDLHPVATGGWMPGETPPPEPGECVGVFNMDNMQPWRTICWWDGTDYRIGRYGVPIHEHCIRWLRIPPDPEEVNSDG